VTPGQFATIYDESGIVLGCGVIDKYLEDWLWIKEQQFTQEVLIQ
jgi:hypothetical protein